MTRPREGAQELGAFLRSRRTSLAPEAVGLVRAGVRRTEGLRREEVATLAHISPGYYQRLEQGRVQQPSVSVLDALATALRLSHEERRHLFALADQARPEAEPEPEPLSSVAGSMLSMLAPPTAAYVINRHSDVLTWNDTASVLFSHLVTGAHRPNNVRFVFTHPQATELFVDWPDVAADSVAHLRAATGHRPRDTRLTELVKRLRQESPEFSRLWDARGLRHKIEGRKHLHHPLVGGMVLDYAVLAVPTVAGQRLVAYTATPGSASHEALFALREAAVGARGTAL